MSDNPNPTAAFEDVPRFLSATQPHRGLSLPDRDTLQLKTNLACHVAKAVAFNGVASVSLIKLPPRFPNGTNRSPHPQCNPSLQHETKTCREANKRWSGSIMKELLTKYREGIANRVKLRSAGKESTRRTMVCIKT